MFLFPFHCLQEVYKTKILKGSPQALSLCCLTAPVPFPSVPQVWIEVNGVIAGLCPAIRLNISTQKKVLPSFHAPQKCLPFFSVPGRPPATVYNIQTPYYQQIKNDPNNGPHEVIPPTASKLVPRTSWIIWIMSRRWNIPLAESGPYKSHCQTQFLAAQSHCEALAGDKRLT